LLKNFYSLIKFKLISVNYVILQACNRIHFS